MMMPTSPCTHFIIRKPGLALGSFEAVFDTMLSLHNTCQFFPRCLHGCIGKVIIILNAIVSCRTAGHYQQFFHRLMLASFSSSHNTTTDNLNNKWAFFAIPNINRCPGTFLKCMTPSINTLKRLFARSPFIPIGRGFTLKITDIRTYCLGQPEGIARPNPANPF